MATLVDEPKPFDPAELCGMCGFEELGEPVVLFCFDCPDEGPDADVEDIGDHLHRTCTRCGFAWTVLPVTDEQLDKLAAESKARADEQKKLAEEERTFTEQRRDLELKKDQKAVTTPKPAAPSAARPRRVPPK